MLPRTERTRRTFRKPLPADCLLDGQLHPNVAARLARVRELPMTAVASLLGVERTAGDDREARLVWEHVEGRSLAEHLAAATDEKARCAIAAKLLDELERALGAMHGFGIVHGAIHERNVIVTPDELIRVTHVSPLLYDDPEVDMSALRRLRERYTNSNDADEQEQQSHAPRRVRWRALALIAAAATAACGLAFAFALLRYATSRQPQHLEPPVAPASSH